MKPTAIMVKGKGDQMVDSITSAYDADKEFKIGDVKSPLTSYLEALRQPDKDGKLPNPVAMGSIIEVNPFGAFRYRKIKDADELRKAITEAESGRDRLLKIMESGVKLRHESKFTEAEMVQCGTIAQTAKFREDFAGGDGSSASQTNPFTEYTPILGGPFSHQLYLTDYLQMMAKSFEAWNHNPMAHQIVKITTQFVLGRGVTVKARDEMVQDAFQKWWDENDMNTRLDFWCDMLSRDGELMIRCFVNPLTQELFVRWVDPSTVWEIVTDLEDIEKVFYYHQQYPTQYQVLYGAPKDAKFNPGDFESSRYVINQIPADEMYHVKVNCSPNEKRGRSDLFSILGWLKRHKDFHTAVVLRAIIQSTFAWKNKLTGADTDVQAYINQFGTDQPEFGSVYVENEASDLQPMTADLKSGTGLADCPGIVNMIAVGSGIPKEYLGISDHATRATAVVASEPGVKKFQSRQLVMARLLKDIGQKWFENELKANRIPKSRPADDKDQPAVIRWMKKIAKTMPMLASTIQGIINVVNMGTVMEPTDGLIEFQFPEIATEDRSAKLKDIAVVQEMGYISKRRAAAMSAKELGIEDFNYEDEQDEIADEAANDLSSIYPAQTGLTEQPPPVPQTPTPPPIPGQSKPFGGGQEPQKKPSGGLSGQERHDIKRDSSQ